MEKFLFKKSIFFLSQTVSKCVIFYALIEHKKLFMVKNDRKD